MKKIIVLAILLLLASLVTFHTTSVQACEIECEETPTPTPTPTQTPDVNRNVPGPAIGNSATPKVCPYFKPVHVPQLFQIDAKSTSVTLFFAPITSDVTDYVVSYGYTANDDEKFNTQFSYGPSTGVISYTITNLSPNITYFFKVAPLNSCVLGEYSNALSATTSFTPTSFYLFK